MREPLIAYSQGRIDEKSCRTAVRASSPSVREHVTPSVLAFEETSTHRLSSPVVQIMRRKHSALCRSCLLVSQYVSEVSETSTTIALL